MKRPCSNAVGYEVYSRNQLVVENQRSVKLLHCGTLGMRGILLGMYPSRSKLLDRFDSNEHPISATRTRPLKLSKYKKSKNSAATILIYMLAGLLDF
jgi:hypothetical protein